MTKARFVTMALAVVALLAPATVRAANPVVVDYELDSTTYVCPVLCTPPQDTGCGPDATGYSDGRRITTSGAATTTVTAVDDDAFDMVAVGDMLSIGGDSGSAMARRAPTWRRVTAKASADSITVDSNVTIADADNARFTLFRLVVNGGWWKWTPSGDGEVFIDIAQMNTTGGIDYKLEARHCYANGVCTTPEILAGPTNKAAAESDRVAFDKEFVDQVRVCFKITTADDGGDTGANAEKITVTAIRN